MKITNKLITFLIIIILAMIIIPTMSVADSDPLKNPGRYTPSNGTIQGNDKFIEKGNNILGYMQAIGSGVSVIMIMVIGIKYMLGSVEEKADYKKTMIPYIIGAVMVFAIPSIIGIIYKLRYK